MPHQSHLVLLAQRQSCTDTSKLPRRHPLYSKRRPNTSLNLRLIHSTEGPERPLDGAVVTLTDERSVTITGRSNATGQISLRTGRAVVPLASLKVSLDLGNGDCLEGELLGAHLCGLNLDSIIECNSTIRVQTV